MQVRKVTTPGCCRVNLGHSHSHWVIKGHGGSIHHTSSEDCPGQMQSQDRSDLAELREECHFPRKVKQTKFTTTKNTQFPCPGQQIPLSLPRLDPYTQQLKELVKQHISQSTGKSYPRCVVPSGPQSGRGGRWHARLQQPPRRTKIMAVAIGRLETPE